MKLSKELPPNIESIRNKLGLNDLTNIVFTYGDTLFNVQEDTIEQHLRDHEETHMRQQSEFGGPDKWWKKYIDDAQFRLEQEVEAYHAQYNSFCSQTRDREKRARFLFELSRHLSGPMYGKIISTQWALYRIKHNKPKPI